MADATYNNQNVYHKQGGDEQVIASGGKITVESSGEIEGQSGGFFDAQAGFDFRFTSSNNTLSAAQMRALLWNQVQFSVIANSAGVLSVLNLPSSGYIIFSIADAASNASAWFTSIGNIPGQVMVLFMRGVGSTGSVFISMSGVSVVGTISGDLSSISLQNSGIFRVGASTGVGLLSGMGFLKLLCTGADEWSVIEKTGGVVERGSS